MISRRTFHKYVATLAALWSLPGKSQQSDDAFVFHSSLAEEWLAGGSFFEWSSTTPRNNNRRVNVFYRTFGNPNNPAIVLLHGYPVHSFDLRPLIQELEQDYYLCTLDFPGFGLSDKPQGDYSYMLADDARLVDHYVRNIVELDEFALFTHDRGVSVGLAFLENFLEQSDPGYSINYHFMCNSGMFLPLATLFDSQTALLNPESGREYIQQLRNEPRQTEGDPVEVAYDDLLHYNDGIGARLGVGKYLLERAANETRWLETLPASSIPVTYFWGLGDPVNPVRIANHVWQTYLNDREAPSSFWYLPDAGHYPHRDQPEQVARLVRMSLQGELPSLQEEETFMLQYALDRSQGEPIFVGHSRIHDMSFPNAVQYSPEGYRNPF